MLASTHGRYSYTHPVLRCRVVKPKTRGGTDLSPCIGHSWVGLFSVCAEYRRAGYRVVYVYRVWANNWLVCVESRGVQTWETC